MLVHENSHEPLYIQRLRLGTAHRYVGTSLTDQKAFRPHKGLVHDVVRWQT